MEEFPFKNICRLCLSKKTKECPLLLFNFSESNLEKFRDLTGIELCLDEQLPDKICSDCSDKLENFHFFKTQLIQKQEQLNAMLLEVEADEDEAEVELIIEEHLESEEEYFVGGVEDLFDDLIGEDNEENYLIDNENEDNDLIDNENEDDDETVEVISLPSVKHLSNTDNDSIINLINEIEEKNDLILQFSSPPTKKRKLRSSSGKAKSSSVHRVSFQPVPRNEELKYEKLTPKLVLDPATSPSELVIPENKAERRQKPLDNPIICCEQVFTFKAEHHKHQLKFHPKTMQCSSCGKILKNKKTLLVHMKSHQSFDERKFKCLFPNCGKAFNFKLHLDNHERTHSGERPFKCTSCTAAFKQSYQLITHRRRHVGMSFECDKCNLTFSTKRQRKRHKNNCPKPLAELETMKFESTNNSTEL